MGGLRLGLEESKDSLQTVETEGGNLSMPALANFFGKRSAVDSGLHVLLAIRKIICSSYLERAGGLVWFQLGESRMLLRWILTIGLVAFSPSAMVSAQAWRNCVPNSMGPGGCDSMGPGGGQSMGPGGGQSMGPGGGQSMGPGGGQSMGPGGGQSLNRNRKLGLNPNTLRPYTCSEGGPC